MTASAAPCCSCQPSALDRSAGPGAAGSGRLVLPVCASGRPSPSRVARPADHPARRPPSWARSAPKHPTAPLSCSVGDLVNKGPRSLDVLRFFAEGGDTVRAVRGNHDEMTLSLHNKLR